VEPSNAIATGSIDDIRGRLLIWARRAPKGLARVEFASDLARQQIIVGMKSQLQEIPLHEIALPSQQDAVTVVAALLEALSQITEGVVSITGFSTAFTNKVLLTESLQILNFNRERLIESGVKQIWWITPSFLQTAIHAMPDINSWFSLRLQLIEMVLIDPPANPNLNSVDGVYANIDDARRRAHNLLQRFQTAKLAGTPDSELLTTYLLPALEALADVGAQKDLHDLTMQFEGLLGQMQLTNSPEVATSIARIAMLYKAQGRYSEAEPLYVRSLSICEQQLGADHPLVATSLNNLAELYRDQGRYSEAEPLHVRSLLIREQQLGADHPDVANSLNNLAAFYESQGRYSEAEPLYVRSLSIREQKLGADHPLVANSLNNLAELYRVQERYSEAESLYIRSLSILQQQLGADHPSVANSLNNLAAFYGTQGRYSEAEPLYVRSLSILQQQLGADHPNVATSLNNLAELYRDQGRYSEAEPLHVRSLSIREQQLGTDHPSVAYSLNNLAGLYRDQGRYSEAEPHYVRALAIFTQTLGANHPNTQTVQKNYELLLRQKDDR